MASRVKANTQVISQQTGVLVCESGSIFTTLLVNLDPAVTIYLANDTPAVSTGDPTQNIPLGPGSSLVVDGSQDWYAATAAGQQASIAIVPGGLNFFQLLNLVLHTLIISGGGEIIGANWILSQLGYVQYNGTPMIGNVIQSLVPQFGFDQFGNPVAGGKITQFITANGQTFLSNEATAIRSGSGGSSPGSWTTIGANFEHSNVSTFSLTPANINDLILVAVAQQSNKTVTATALTSTNATWTLIGSFKGVNNTRTISIFSGKASAASASTVTVTWSGAAPAIIRIAGQEFQSSSGTFSSDGALTTMDTASAQTTWPTATPAGANELYWGYNIVAGTPTNGSQPGFTYIKDASGNSMAFNDSVSSPVGAIFGNATQEFGAAVLMIAGSGGGGNFTGLIMAPGSQDAQTCQIWNTSPTATLTFAAAAISNISDSDGVSSEQILPLTAAGYIWSADDALWYPL